VIPLNIGLLEENKIAKLYKHGSSINHSFKFKENENNYISVEVKSLDSLLSELQIEKIDILKIDTEGSEVPILKGAKETLKKNNQMKIFVASYHYPEQVREVTKLLNECGFSTKVDKNGIVSTA